MRERALVAAASDDEVGDVLSEGAPEEFLDPIEYVIMRDPVRLPTSNVTCDRKVITRHLLSDSTDPFTRQHLNVSMLEPMEDLKRKINEWIQVKKSLRIAKQ